MESIDFAALEEYIYENRLIGEKSVHGLSHWHQVEFNALLLAKKTHADETVLRLFALFHDSRRIHDGYDEEHGPRGAELAVQLRGKLFDLDEERFQKLVKACQMHTVLPFSGDPTIDTCFDADRLDLGRVYVVPDPQKMATDFGKKLASKLQNVPVEKHREWLRTQSFIIFPT
ncbi:MAG: hypothetical protein J6Z31_05220 [Fibrobacter sp.]|nr:hypothetical protein [Fibrobacter sp.]